MDIKCIGRIRLIGCILFFLALPVSAGGGYIFAPIHIIQDGVPVENIMAMWETQQEYVE